MRKNRNSEVTSSHIDSEEEESVDDYDEDDDYKPEKVS